MTPIDSTTSPLDLLLWFAPLWLVVLWIFLSYLVAYVSGWYILGKTYRDTTQFKGPWQGFQSGKIGPLVYPATLWIGTSNQGLYLRTGPRILFGLGHPTLLIPWAKITSYQKSELGMETCLTIELEDPGAQLQLPMSQMKGLKQVRPGRPPG